MKLLMMCLLLTFHSYHEALSGQSYEQYLSDLEQIHVQMFKEKLLKELGLSSVPNISKEQTPKFPKFFKDYLESELKDFAAKHTDSNNLKTGKEDLFLFAKQVTSQPNGGRMNYIFNSRSRNSNLMIRSATLWIHLVESLSTTVDKKPNHSNSDLHLYKKYISATENGYGMTRQLFHSERLKAAAGWHKVTVTGTVKEWFSLHVDHDLGLDVEMKGTPSLVIGNVSDNATGQTLQPFLAVEAEEKQSLNRKKRDKVLTNCSATAPLTCCLHEWRVNFSAIGLHFVHLPKTATVNFCAGSCKSSGLYRPSPAARLNMLKRLYGRRVQDLQCCRPLFMESETLLVVLENGTTSTHLVSRMKAKSCQCSV
ncbi:hypothetical protein pdam_00012676 [Pocillopora damicornis]|uniref:TGF-beta family profile domain-containing protein n=1 Tax=Pocillopora damicornis TaxID=46731 RepID=A0A3M6U0W4_POCDA|nr:transforming growth factor beta-1 proprotein-like [Pocillopora damicornis]RMX47290.1 hypothetical protein pdam_00012676 [Pocillopora damicornis]